MQLVELNSITTELNLVKIFKIQSCKVRLNSILSRITNFEIFSGVSQSQFVNQNSCSKSDYNKLKLIILNYEHAPYDRPGGEDAIQFSCTHHAGMRVLLTHQKVFMASLGHTNGVKSTTCALY